MADELPGRLRDLGAALTVRVPPDLADRVLADVARAPARRGTAWRRWLAGLGALVAAAGVAFGVSAPVRATLLDAFGFAGVEVYRAPGPTPAASPALPGEHRTDIEGAQREVGFQVRLPAALGQPDSVTVADGRVVSLHYERPDGPVRIDEFVGDLGVMWDKYAQFAAQRTTLNGGEALWFEHPVALVYVGPDGVEHTDSTRLTDGTLIWTEGPLTLRLDGIRPLQAALAVAGSMH